MNGVDFLQAESLLTGKEASPEVHCTFPSLQSYGPTEPFPIKHQEQQAELAVAGVGFSSANKAFRWEMSWPGPSAQKVKPAGSSYQVTITSMPGKRLWCLQLDSHWKHLSQHPSHTPTGAQAGYQMGLGWKQSIALLCMHFYCLYWDHTFLIYGTVNGKATPWVMQGKGLARLLSFWKRTAGVQSPWQAACIPSTSPSSWCGYRRERCPSSGIWTSNEALPLAY